jgi:hypothetical protein
MKPAWAYTTTCIYSLIKYLLIHNYYYVIKNNLVKKRYSFKSVYDRRDGTVDPTPSPSY